MLSKPKSNQCRRVIGKRFNLLHIISKKRKSLRWPFLGGFQNWRESADGTRKKQKWWRKKSLKWRPHSWTNHSISKTFKHKCNIIKPRRIDRLCSKKQSNMWQMCGIRSFLSFEISSIYFYDVWFIIISDIQSLIFRLIT